MESSTKLNTNENLRKYVSENYEKIPIFKALTKEEIEKFIEKGSVGLSLEHSTEDGLTTRLLQIDKRGSDNHDVIAGYCYGVDEYGEDCLYATTQMEFDEEGNFVGTIYGDNIDFQIDQNGETEMKFPNDMQETIYNSVMKNKEIATHFGDDLDNKSATYAIEYWLKRNGLLANGEEIKISRVPAGQVKTGVLNVDTGGHKGNRVEDETIVIDGDIKNGVKSASESLSKIGIYVPEQIVELADSISNKVSPLDSRSGLSLVRYLSGQQSFRLAEEGLLDKSLTDEQLKHFGLVEAHEKQKSIIYNAVNKINEYTTQLPNGEKIVLAPERIMAGALIAYEMGINYYASVEDHYDSEKKPDGVTFAITSKPGVKLPESVLEFGRDLAEKYRIDENSSGVFVNPNGQMIVAGSFKNPKFKIDNETKESMLETINGVFLGKEKEDYRTVE